MDEMNQVAGKTRHRDALNLVAAAAATNSRSGSEAGGGGGCPASISSNSSLNNFTDREDRLIGNIFSSLRFNSCFNTDLDRSRSVPQNEIHSPQFKMIYSLLAMFESNDRLEFSETLLRISKTQESNQWVRQPDCLMLLVELIHNQSDITTNQPTEEDLEVHKRASAALRNSVLNLSDEQRKKCEFKILQPLEILRTHVLKLRLNLDENISLSGVRRDRDLFLAVAQLMSFSFDERDRRVTLKLGGLQAIAETLIMDQFTAGSTCDATTVQFRKNIGMALTNLTFGAHQSKQLLCNYPKFLEMLNKQIESDVDGLRLVFAGVLRNLSCAAEPSSKLALRDSGAVKCLARAVLRPDNGERTLKNVLSALWNLSAHCVENKHEFCSTPGVLQYLVRLLRYEPDYDDSLPQRMAILENGGGILHHISSHIAVNEDLRAILRRSGCFEILLSHLKYSSLTVVSNACGTLLNLSAVNVEDQQRLLQLGAPDCLRPLVHSKHNLISLGSRATLNNLRPGKLQTYSDSSRVGSISDFPSSHNGRKLSSTHVKSTMAVDHTDDDSSQHKRQHLQQTQTQQQQCRDRSATRRYHTNVRRSIPQNATTVDSTVAGMMTGAGIVERSSVDNSQGDEEMIRSYNLESGHVIVPISLGCLATRHQDQETTTSFPIKSTNVRFNLAADQPPILLFRGRHHQSFVGEQTPPPNDETVKMYACEGIMPSRASSSAGDLRLLIGDDRDAEITNARDTVVGQVETIKTDDGQNIVSYQQLPTSGSNSKPSTCTATPMVFSRHSSVQSLDSCEQNSVRSTAYSEYSQLPTGVHSPSEIPDSPTLASPPNLKRPVKSGVQSILAPPDKQSPDRAVQSVVSSSIRPVIDASKTYQSFAVISNQFPVGSTLADFLFEQQPKSYGVELECSKVNSTASSFSALTIDGETKIKPIRRPKTSDEDVSGRRCDIIDVSSPIPSSSSPSRFKKPHGLPPRRSKLLSVSTLQCPVDAANNGDTSTDGDNGEVFSTPTPNVVNDLIQLALPKPLSRSQTQKLKQEVSLITIPRNVGAVITPNAQVIHAATNYRGKSVAVAKPIFRRDGICVSGSSSSTLPNNGGDSRDDELRDLRVYATEETPASLRSSFGNLSLGDGCVTSSSARRASNVNDGGGSSAQDGEASQPTATPPVSVSEKSTADQSPKLGVVKFENSTTIGGVRTPSKTERTDVEECIYSALPKKKKGRSEGCKKSVPTNAGLGVGILPKVSAGCVDAFHKTTSDMVSRDMSCSMEDCFLVTSIRPTMNLNISQMESSLDSSLLMNKDLMQTSTTNNLVKSHTTMENIKDAAILMPQNESIQSVKSPSNQISARYTRVRKKCLVSNVGNSPTMEARKSSDEEETANGSLSEDNYSTIEGETFDVTFDDLIDDDPDCLSTYDDRVTDLDDLELVVVGGDSSKLLKIVELTATHGNATVRSKEPCAKPCLKLPTSSPKVRHRTTSKGSTQSVSVRRINCVAGLAKPALPPKPVVSKVPAMTPSVSLVSRTESAQCLTPAPNQTSNCDTSNHSVGTSTAAIEESQSPSRPALITTTV